MHVKDEGALYFLLAKSANQCHARVHPLEQVRTSSLPGQLCQ